MARCLRTAGGPPARGAAPGGGAEALGAETPRGGEAAGRRRSTADAEAARTAAQLGGDQQVWPTEGFNPQNRGILMPSRPVCGADSTGFRSTWDL